MDLVPVKDYELMARNVAATGWFGFKKSEEAMVIMLIAHSEGIHPMKAVQQYHVIEGKPSLKSDAMLARFQQSGGKIEWKSCNDTEAVAVFSHPAGGTLEVNWNLKRAAQAGLANKSNWKCYPQQMLKARCISEGVRSVFPACINSMYTPEETMDFSESEMIDTSNTIEVVADQYEEPLAIKYLGQFGIKRGDLEQWTGKEVEQWTADEIEQCRMLYKSLRAQSKQEERTQMDIGAEWIKRNLMSIESVDCLSSTAMDTEY
jgi:hypothetical protein